MPIPVPVPHTKPKPKPKKKKPGLKPKPKRPYPKLPLPLPRPLPPPAPIPVPAPAPAPITPANFLYVASYSGTVTTLDLSGLATCACGIPGAPGTVPGAYPPGTVPPGTVPPGTGPGTIPGTTVTARLLRTLSSTTACTGNPSWLTLSRARSMLLCVGEGLSGTSALTAFRTEQNGALTPWGAVGTLAGPVSGVLYGSSGTGFAMAH